MDVLVLRIYYYVIFDGWYFLTYFAFDAYFDVGALLFAVPALVDFGGFLGGLVTCCVAKVRANGVGFFGILGCTGNIYRAELLTSEWVCLNGIAYGRYAETGAWANRRRFRLF